MGYTPITPFRRMVDAVQMQHQAIVAAPLPERAVAKWDVLRELSVAKAAFGLSDRDLGVLQALLSFYPALTLDQPEKMVVFPSNQSVCDRLNGMPSSTMRRHLANLVAAGVILRRDSPNGKRYLRLHASGPQAFGFDLSPLPRLFGRILSLADQIRAEAAEIAELRERINLMRRDLRGLWDYANASAQAINAPCPTALDDLARHLRRKLSRDELKNIAHQLAQMLLELQSHPTFTEVSSSSAEEMSTNNARIEQHYQSSNKDLHESESCQGTKASVTAAPSKMPLDLVLSACPEILEYALDPVHDWQGFQRLAEHIRPMMGICGSAWAQAKRSMGDSEAAITLAAMLQRMGEIRSPGSYLRSLSSKAVEGIFTSGPMIRALMGQNTPQMTAQTQQRSSQL